jgi:hypothetical protein
MTIEETLIKLRETERCWLVWNKHTSEVVTVVAWTPQLSQRTELFWHLDSYEQYKRLLNKSQLGARLFDSAEVTRELVEEVVRKAQIEGERRRARIQERTRITTAWSVASAEELIAVVERGEYPEPMKKDDNSRHILEHLWKLHRDELTEAMQNRLHLLIGSTGLSARASRELEYYLCALRGDREKLLERWRLYQLEEARLEELWRLAKLDPSERLRFSEDDKELFRQPLGVYHWILMDCFCHIQLHDQGIISYLIGLVEEPLPLFLGYRYKAMMTLGILDAARGTRAAEVIQKIVYDGKPHPTAVRDRVLQRLETNASDWRRCPSCCHGRVHHPENGFIAINCPDCLGFWTVHLTAA